MQSRFYREELEYLRELAREFAREHPVLAPALADAGSDPDVERVLEATAFLTGALRQKLVDDLPELTQTMIEMLWPHYLRPVPSTTILELVHPRKPKVTATEVIPAGEMEVDSVPVDGTPCRFRTCYPVRFQPLRVAEARVEPEGRGLLRVRFEVVGNAKFEELDLDPLRLHLHGDLPVTTALYLQLLRHAESVELECGSGRDLRRAVLPRRPWPLAPVGFGDDEGLFPWPRRSFLGYRLLQEYFTLRQKFLFLDVTGLGALRELRPENGFDLVVRFRDRPREGLRVSADNVRLHCTPVVNLLSKDADPIRVDHRRSSYLVRPADPEPDHFEVYAVERVTGLVPGTPRRVEYRPFYAFRHRAGAGGAAYYKLHRRAAAGKDNSDCHLSFVDAVEQPAQPEVEVVSVDLACTNRRLAESLKPGDVSRHTDRSPQFAEFRNIAPVTPSVIPPLEGDFHWRLISHLSLNMSSLASASALRAMLSLYDFAALHDRQAQAATERQLEGIRDVRTRESERLFRGAVMRGVDTTLTLQEDRFSSEGEMYLFASVLEEFLSLYVTTNAFSRLTVVGAQKGERYEWRPRVGAQFLL